MDYKPTKEDLKKLAKALTELPSSEREIIVLTYYTGNTPEEIGKKLGLDSITFEKKIKRAEENISKLMGWT